MATANQPIMAGNGFNTGVFNAGQNPSMLNARSFAATILRLFPNGNAPLFALTSQSGKSKAKASTHGYFSKSMAFVTVQLAADEAGTPSQNTALQVADTSQLSPGMVLFNPRTRENIRVNSITDATHFNAARGFGRVAAALILAADKLLHIGTAFEEGSQRPAARALKVVYVSNFTQIFRNAWALTDTARASYAEAGYSNIAESRKDCALFHSTDIEGAMWLGQAKMDVYNGQPMHTTQGLIDSITQYAPTHVNTAGSSTSYDDLIDMVTPAYQYSTDQSNPKERILFTGNHGIRVIDTIGRKSGQVYIQQSETSFGMHFTQFRFHKGTINMIEHPLFNGWGLDDMAVIVDLPAVKQAYLDGRDTLTEEYAPGKDTGDFGVDAQGGSLTSELAVENVNPYSMAVIYGLNAAA